MRRLYLQIYLGFVLITVLLIAVAAIPDALYWAQRPPPTILTSLAEMIAKDLPRRGPDLDRRLPAEAERLGLDATLWDADQRVIASTRQRVGPPRPARGEAHWLQRPGPPGLAVHLDDGSWLALSLRHDDERGAHRWPVGLLVFAGIVALGALPLARRITRRLERLRTGVEKLGAGDLGARVPVEGRDEIAQLATSFNGAAERIQTLVETQRRMLASASHELRTPLARLRIALELMSEDAPEKLTREAAADVAELDELIEDLLLTARLESAPRGSAVEDVDLLGLVAEEAARIGAEVTGESAPVCGDARLLRRLARNLLQNARRYGGPGPIEVRVESTPDGARLDVSDRGPGIPDAERELVFEAFHRATDHSEGRDGGVGLGLALVREIARHHGGDASCLPRDGGGTTFRVHLARVAPRS